MTAPDTIAEIGPPRPSDTRWITRTVTFLAIAVFTVSGSHLGPVLFGPNGAQGAMTPSFASAFVLNIALILFAWRRSEQLKKTFAERDAAESRAYDLAYYDEVTGLFNRRRLKELLRDLSDGEVSRSALILIDLDGFKKINDLYGHAVGDELLFRTSERLKRVSPPDAHCVRLGGDEFAILLQDESATEKQVAELAEVLLVELSKPVEVANTLTAVGVSIGSAALVTTCTEADWLLRRADVAMYEAKKSGRNRYLRFSGSMELELQQRAQFEAEMRAGIEAGEFVPFFQPIVDLPSGTPRGFEALARWRHPTKGLLEPAEFMPLAEATGMISDLSFDVMQEGLAIARDWPSHLKIAVNISPVQFNDPLIAARIMKVLATTGFPAERLEVEVREESLLQNHDAALAILTSLKNQGISISVDDFGVGYAVLTKLGSMPFDRIKIDRSLMASLMDKKQGDTLVRAISAVGKGLKIPVTAEGVETRSIQAKLKQLGCSDAQGWVYGKALSAEEVVLGLVNAEAGPGLSRKSAKRA